MGQTETRPLRPEVGVLVAGLDASAALARRRAPGALLGTLGGRLVAVTEVPATGPPAQVTIIGNQLLQAYPSLRALILLAPGATPGQVVVADSVIQHDSGVVRPDTLITAPAQSVSPLWIRAGFEASYPTGTVLAGNVDIRDEKERNRLLTELKGSSVDSLSAGLLALNTEAGVVSYGTGAVDQLLVILDGLVTRLALSAPRPPPSEVLPLFSTVIITREPFEAQALMARFDEVTMTSRPSAVWPDTLLMGGRLGRRTVLVACRATPGRHYNGAELARLATDLRRRYPRALYAGMAVAGSAVPDVCLGDVVLGTQLVQFDRGLALPEGYQLAATATRDLHQLGTREPTGRWADMARLPQRVRRLPRAHRGIIAAGDLVVEDRTTRDELHTAHHCLALVTGHAGPVEAGLAYLLVVGIGHRCDGRDISRDYDRYAAENAAAYLAEYLHLAPQMA